MLYEVITAPDIEPGAADHHRQFSLSANAGNRRFRQTNKIGHGKGLIRSDDIEQMMGNHAPFRRGRLGSYNFV